MDLNSWFNYAKDVGYSAISRTCDVAGAGVGYLKSTVGQTWIFGSTESSSSYGDTPVDEKHYFLVPDCRSEVGFSLYAMRCLPDGVPPINDLPKRRLFHLPNEHALPTVEHILLSDARETVSDSGDSGSLSARLTDLANQVDRLDDRAFGGVLLIGGLVALVNPVAGAAVALKALVPSIGLLLSKYGLQYAGEAASTRELSSRIKTAERDVRQQFKSAGTESIVNPLLRQLERALATTVDQYDPVEEFYLEDLAFGKEDCDRLLHLTCQAISNTYEGISDTPAQWEAAKLGPEDIEYLKLIKEMAAQPS